MNKEIIKNNKKSRRKAKISAKIKGRSSCPRLSVHRSNTSLYLQVIDDRAGRTLVSAHSRELKIEGKKKAKLGKVELSFELGKLLAAKAATKKISRVVFDRSSYKYHGRVKAAADGAREGGLKF